MKPIYTSMYDQIQPPEILVLRTRLRMQQHAEQPQNKNKWRLPLVAALAVSMMMVCLALINLDGSTSLAPLPTTGPIAILTPLSDDTHVPDVQLSQGELHFVPTDGYIADASLYFDAKTMEEHVYDQAQMVNYLGRDFRPAYVPEDLYAQDGAGGWKVVTWKKDGTTVHENFSVTYQQNFSDTYQPLRRQVRVEAAKDKLPTQCAVYQADDARTSTIQGVPVEVTYTEMKYGPYTKDRQPAGTYPIYRAAFIYEGIGYIVHGENITQKEFIDVLCSLFV